MGRFRRGSTFQEEKDSQFVGSCRLLRQYWHSTDIKALNSLCVASSYYYNIGNVLLDVGDLDGGALGQYHRRALTILQEEKSY